MNPIPLISQIDRFPETSPPLVHLIENSIDSKSKDEETMSYYFTTFVDKSFDQTIDYVTDELKKNGFGVLTTIDVATTLQKKLDVNFRNYKILGACNPPLAYKALQAEDKIGTMLPCNVIVQEHENGRVEVSAIDPIASMQAVQNEAVGQVTLEVHGLLKNMIERL
jgi:uncharacterized protein (DUF302 family)